MPREIGQCADDHPGNADGFAHLGDGASLHFDCPTVQFAVQPGAELYGLEQLSGGLVIFGGGIPLTDGDVVIGAIGVSAGSVEQDISVAEAGVAALGS